jgi:DNA processing protein
MTGVQKIDISSKEYPKLLKEIPDPPEQLYVKGSIEGGIFDNCVGVVGTRDMSEYGKKATSYIICGLYSHITVELIIGLTIML